MQNLVKVLIGLAALAFVLGAVQGLTGFQVMAIVPESLSRASNNLALIAIALTLCCKAESKEAG